MTWAGRPQVANTGSLARLLRIFTIRDCFEFTVKGEVKHFETQIDGVKRYPIGAYGWYWKEPPTDAFSLARAEGGTGLPKLRGGQMNGHERFSKTDADITREVAYGSSGPSGRQFDSSLAMRASDSISDMPTGS